MIILRDLYYYDNKVEMIIDLRDKQFDGQINKAIVDIKFKFGIQCYNTSPGLCREYNQEINQQIIWTEEDVERLLKGIKDAFKVVSENHISSFIGLLEPEFEARCFFHSEDLVELYVTIGISAIGPTIRLTTTKDELMRWANEIKTEFYDVN